MCAKVKLSDRSVRHYVSVLQDMFLVDLQVSEGYVYDKGTKVSDKNTGIS